MQFWVVRGDGSLTTGNLLQDFQTGYGLHPVHCRRPLSYTTSLNCDSIEKDGAALSSAVTSPISSSILELELHRHNQTTTKRAL